MRTSKLAIEAATATVPVNNQLNKNVSKLATIRHVQVLQKLIICALFVYFILIFTVYAHYKAYTHITNITVKHHTSMVPQKKVLYAYSIHTVTESSTEPL